MTNASPPKFPLGEVVITANAAQHLDTVAVYEALRRHGAGDGATFRPKTPAKTSFR